MGYTYDKDGDRLTETRNGQATNYSYAPGSQRLQATTGAANQGYAHDANGNTVQAGSLTFAYGPGGELLADLDGSGTPQAEHVWLGGMPLAVVKGGQVAYVHPDRLGTPRLITVAAGTPVWRWTSDPFGTAQANQDPDGDGTPFVYNLRFPGQYFDIETGLHCNAVRRNREAYCAEC